MRIIVTLLVLLLARPLPGQHVLRAGRTEPDLDDLNIRLSESAYVIKGRVLEPRIIMRRPPLPKKQVAPNVWELDADALAYGTLFTVAVEETVCRQADFALAQPRPQPLTNLVRIFVPPGKPSLMRSTLDPSVLFVTENLWSPGREYLLFLREAPGQDEMVATYQLDSGVTYYRTYEGDRGAVALPDAANPEGPYAFITPLVSAVTAFCDAVKAPDAETKIRNLNAVKGQFVYPAWNKSVDAAVSALQTVQAQPPQSR